jgi:hypothetical protein
MPETTPIEPGTGPSLADILWRAMNRFGDEPEVLDVEEFTSRIAETFEGDLPAEEWVEKFFAGHADPLRRLPRDVAEAVVRATRDRLHVYKFNLAKLDYVIVEDKDKVVIVSDMGQFALQNTDMVRSALEGAIVRTPSGAPLRPGGLRENQEPRAFFVRTTGEVVAVDVKKVGRALEQFIVKQVATPAIKDPALRLMPLKPSRTRVSDEREERILRLGDPRMRLAMPTPPAPRPAGAAPPQGAETAVFVLMPDGSLARPAIGSATRWQQMVGDWVARASGEGPGSSPVPVTSQQRFLVDSGRVVALFEGGLRPMPGDAGQMAQVRGQAMSSVRADAAPIRILGDDELAKAIARGAMVVPGLAAKDRFWVQPEQAFVPQRREVEMAQVAPQPTPLQLGQITGDPWADWALMGGEPGARGRRAQGVYRAALDRDMSAPPELAEKLRNMRGQELFLRGGRVVAFRAPDGSVVVNREGGPIRLARSDRPGQPSRGQPIALRTGAIPSMALEALRMALERTAAAGGYKLPLASLVSAPNALDVGAAMNLDAGDARRASARLAGNPTLLAGARGQVAQLMLSMPFPNGSEMHVGSDLADALQQYLGMSVQPASSSGSAWIGSGAGLGAAGGGALAFASSGGWGSLHTQAAQNAENALLSLSLPDVQRLLAGSQSQSQLPTLLARAMDQSGSWTPGPGAPMPLAIREFALKGPFEDLPEMVAVPMAAPSRRPLNPGEDEIVIPLPLWAQMGRGRISATDQIMASPLAPEGYAPPLGNYRLVAPHSFPLDYTGGAPIGTPGVIQLAGPSGLDLSLARAGNSVQARSLGGRYLLGMIAVDDGETVIGPSGRVRIGQAPRSSGTLVMPQIDAGSLPSFPVSGSRPMAGALSSALQMSSDVESRALPGIQSPASGSLTSGFSADNGFTSRAAAAGRADAASSMSGLDGSQTLVSGGAFSAQLSQGASDSGQAATEAASAASAATQRLSSDDGYITGLPPGAWSGAQSGEPGYMRWSYSSNRSPTAQNVGGVNLSGLSRPIYPSLPASLRFRYAGAPLWWAAAGGGSGDADDEPATRAMRSGLRAATSAASLWKSIFLASPGWGGGSDRLDALSAASLVTGGAVAGGAAGAGAETVYVAMNNSGAAGTTTAARARADAIEMSIVAAIPPQPPPLESMGAVSEVAHARGKGHGRHGNGVADHDKEDGDRTSHSKIEGSVDAIAQRIYHRIRRRIQNDRERFGG